MNAMEEIHSFDVVVLTLFGILMLLGSTGNLCILVSIFNNRNLRRVTHMLIMNQAASDFLLSALSIPLRLLRICVKKSIFESKVLSSNEFCHISSGLNAAVLGASSYGLLLLTVDKFLAVKQPLVYRARMTKSYMIIPVVASWLVPLAMGLCGAFIDVLQADLHDHSHDVACIQSSTYSKIFTISMYAILLILPLITMFPLYIYIIAKVKSSGRVFNCSITNESMRRLPYTANSRHRSVHEETRRKRDMKLTKGIILMLSANLLCLTPIVIMDFIHIIFGLPIPYIMDEICLLLLHLNAVLDPLIYTRHIPGIQRTMARLQVTVVQVVSQWSRMANTTTQNAPPQLVGIAAPNDESVQGVSFRIRQRANPVKNTSVTLN